MLSSLKIKFRKSTRTQLKMRKADDLQKEQIKTRLLGKKQAVPTSGVANARPAPDSPGFLPHGPRRLVSGLPAFPKLRSPAQSAVPEAAPEGHLVEGGEIGATAIPSTRISKNARIKPSYIKCKMVMSWQR